MLLLLLSGNWLHRINADKPTPKHKLGPATPTYRTSCGYWLS